MEKLVINRVYRNGSKLVCEIEIRGVKNVLQAIVDEEYADYLTDDRADGFFVICMYKCFKEGLCLESKVPVSTRLLYQVKNYMMNVYCEAYHVSPFSVEAPTTDVVLPSAGGVGTGITCGVDSLYTVACHCNLGGMQCLPKYQLSHLVLMNVGSHDIGKEDTATLFSNRVTLAKNFCNKYGFKFVEIDTDFRAFLPYDYTEYHGIVNGSVILLLEKLFGIYYSSSSYKISEFKLNRYDVSQFELFNLAVLSTDNTTFYTTGGDVSRYDKVKLLSQWEPSFNFLNVCNSYSTNCSKQHCVKCCRTMIELDALNALENYKSVFNLELYEKNKYDYLGEFYARKVLRHDHYALEMWDDLTKKYSIPFHNKVKALWQFVVSRMRIYDLKRIILLLKLSR